MKNEEMARLFSEATPYIQKYHGKTMVIKYGGNAMINETLKNAVMNDLVTLTRSFMTAFFSVSLIMAFPPYLMTMVLPSSVWI